MSWFSCISHIPIECWIRYKGYLEIHVDFNNSLPRRTSCSEDIAQVRNTLCLISHSKMSITLFWQKADRYFTVCSLTCPRCRSAQSRVIDESWSYLDPSFNDLPVFANRSWTAQKYETWDFGRMREDVGKLRVLSGVDFLNIGHDYYSERTVLQTTVLLSHRPARMGTRATWPKEFREWMVWIWIHDAGVQKPEVAAAY